MCDLAGDKHDAFLKLQSCCEQLARYCAPKGRRPFGPSVFSIFGAWGACIHFGIGKWSVFLFSEIHSMRHLQVFIFYLCGPCNGLVCGPWAAEQCVLQLRVFKTGARPCATNMAYGHKANIRKTIHIYIYIYVYICIPACGQQKCTAT